MAGLDTRSFWITTRRLLAAASGPDTAHRPVRSRREWSPKPYHLDAPVASALSAPRTVDEMLPAIRERAACEYVAPPPRRFPVVHRYDRRPARPVWDESTGGIVEHGIEFPVRSVDVQTRQRMVRHYVDVVLTHADGSTQERRLEAWPRYEFRVRVGRWAEPQRWLKLDYAPTLAHYSDLRAEDARALEDADAWENALWRQSHLDEWRREHQERRGADAGAGAEDVIVVQRREREAALDAAVAAPASWRSSSKVAPAEAQRQVRRAYATQRLRNQPRRVSDVRARLIDRIVALGGDPTDPALVAWVQGRVAKYGSPLAGYTACLKALDRRAARERDAAQLDVTGRGLVRAA